MQAVKERADMLLESREPMLALVAEYSGSYQSGDYVREIRQSSVRERMKILAAQYGITSWMASAAQAEDGFDSDRPVVSDAEYEKLAPAKRGAVYCHSQLQGKFLKVLCAGLCPTGGGQWMILQDGLFLHAGAYERILNRQGVTNIVHHKPNEGLENSGPGLGEPFLYVPWIVEARDGDGKLRRMEFTKTEEADLRLRVPLRSGQGIDSTESKARRRALKEFCAHLAMGAINAVDDFDGGGDKRETIGESDDSGDVDD